MLRGRIISMRVLARVAFLLCCAGLAAGLQADAQSTTGAELGALYNRAAAYFQAKDYARALNSCEEWAKAVEKAEAAEGGTHNRTAEALGGVAWYALFAKQPQKALKAAERALELAPGTLWVETNRAHALMFLGRTSEAVEAYRRHKGATISGQGKWEGVIRKDFAKFRVRGLNPSMIDAVEKALAKPPEGPKSSNKVTPKLLDGGKHSEAQPPSGAVREDRPAKGWLGATVEDLLAEDAAKLGMESPHGVKLTARAAGGPAEKAGLETGDVILSLDRTLVENKSGFEADLAAKAPGTEVKLIVRRGASEKRLTVALAAGQKPVPGVEMKPVLQLDTGGHMARIRDLAFTPDGKFIVSAGDDKVIRVWDWRKGVTVRAIRGQSGLGAEGKIYAMALSSDGRWLAASGYFEAVCPAHCQQAIRLYDFASGELKALLETGDGVVSLAFSPDGNKLISGSVDDSAIIWDVERGTPLSRLEGHEDGVYAVGFTPDGARAVTASGQTLRLWRVADGTLIKERKGFFADAERKGHNATVTALAVSSRGAIASGDGHGEIWLWDGMTGAALKMLANSAQTSFAIGSLRFSPDGAFLLSAAGTYGWCGGSCGYVQHIWDVESGREVTAYAKHDNSVFASAYSADGGLVATGGFNGDVQAWEPKAGETKAVQKGTGLPVGPVGFSADGRSIAWGPRNTAETMANADLDPLERTFRLPEAGQTLSAPQPLDSAGRWIQSGVKTYKLSMKAGADTAPLEVSRAGSSSPVSVALDPTTAERLKCVGISPDGKIVIVGGNLGVLTAYSPDGKKLGDFVGHESTVWAVAASPDGRYLVSGSADQTVRLWNLQTRELIVTIFRGEDGEWVIWTPQGYYTGSPGADKIVGWQINKGPDQAAGYVTAEQLRKHLNRPDIVAKAIQLASAGEAVRTSYGTQFKLVDLLARPAPQLSIISPAGDSQVNAAGSIAVKIALGVAPDPATLIRVQVNGRQLDDYLPENGPSFPAGEHEFKVPLAKGKNTIVVTALNEIGWSKVQDGTLTLTNAGLGDLDKRGTLYILAIGVSKYPGVPRNCPPKPNCDLNFTGNDAVAFAGSVEDRLGTLHEKVVRRVLVNEGASDGPPTASNILNALGIFARAQPNDTTVLFLAGHGFNDGPNYRFVSTDATVADGMILPASVVPWYAIEEAIDRAKGRRLLFIDTCHAAGAYNERLGNSAYYANILAYSSARWDQEALESDAMKHGIFTAALLEGLSGKADASKAGHVDTVQLGEYLQRRVPELAKPFRHEQNPQFFKGRDAESYTLAVTH
jgi:WD40 repeat protein